MNERIHAILRRACKLIVCVPLLAAIMIPFREPTRAKPDAELLVDRAVPETNQENKPERKIKFRNLVNHARERTDLNSPAGAPYHLHARVKVFRQPDDTPIDGEYDYLRLSVDHWREEFTMGSFHQIVERDGAVGWRQPSAPSPSIEYWRTVRALNLQLGLCSAVWTIQTQLHTARQSAHHSALASSRHILRGHCSTQRIDASVLTAQA